MSDTIINDEVPTVPVTDTPVVVPPADEMPETPEETPTTPAEEVPAN